MHYFSLQSSSTYYMKFTASYCSNSYTLWKTQSEFRVTSVTEHDTSPSAVLKWQQYFLATDGSKAPHSINDKNRAAEATPQHWPAGNIVLWWRW